ncbi:unnamed protein product [Colias eurytheme]|nr:unnamed protein product [Colias eurytheme]
MWSILHIMLTIKKCLQGGHGGVPPAAVWPAHTHTRTQTYKQTQMLSSSYNSTYKINSFKLVHTRRPRQCELESNHAGRLFLNQITQMSKITEAVMLLLRALPSPADTAAAGRHRVTETPLTALHSITLYYTSAERSDEPLARRTRNELTLPLTAPAASAWKCSGHRDPDSIQLKPLADDLHVMGDNCVAIMAPSQQSRCHRTHANDITFARSTSELEPSEYKAILKPFPTYSTSNCTALELKRERKGKYFISALQTPLFRKGIKGLGELLKMKSVYRKHSPEYRAHCVRVAARIITLRFGHCSVLSALAAPMLRMCRPAARRPPAAHPFAGLTTSFIVHFPQYVFQIPSTCV